MSDKTHHAHLAATSRDWSVPVPAAGELGNLFIDRLPLAPEHADGVARQEVYRHASQSREVNLIYSEVLSQSERR